ncbi:uncharacterized protein [Argopecten irradians]|uniref:uncharacterized protein n=1 Tax=Argopecten irradians TaxID=31199 RepID=UPI003714FE9F
MNTEKTKIVVFRNGRNIKESESWTYEGKGISVVDEFCYLGVLLQFNNKFKTTIKHIASQARKAVFALRAKCNQVNFNIKTLLHLFDTYIVSILHYACETWAGFKADEVEKVHIEFCKNILCVKKSTCNAMVYYELGRFPLVNQQIFKAFKYWFKLLNSNNCILKEIYQFFFKETEKVHPKHNFLVFIKQKLSELGLGYIWLRQSPADIILLPLIKQRIDDQTKQLLLATISTSSKCDLFRYLVDDVTLQFYLTKSLSKQRRISVSKLRLSAHNLAIETGRYRNVERNNRLCRNCELFEIEDEYHFLFICPKFSDIRRKYIKNYFWVKPSVYKVIELLNTHNMKDLNSLGKYIIEANNSRIT